MRFKAGRNVNAFPADELREIVDGKVSTRADVKHLSLPHFFTLGGQEIGAYRVAHMREVARLRAISGDSNRFAFLSLLQKLADGKRVRAVWIEPRSVHIEVTQCYRFKTVHLAPDLAVELADILLQPIRTFWIGRHRFNKRHGRLVAVGRA